MDVSFSTERGKTTILSLLSLSTNAVGIVIGQGANISVFTVIEKIVPLELQPNISQGFCRHLMQNPAVLTVSS